MAGAGAVGGGLGIMGGILGGIGDIIQANKYERPSLPDPSQQERRLRQLALSQLQGGGQQLLGATALYNQMAPLLMSQLPGMRYIPGSLGDAGDEGGQSPIQSYQDALGNMQQVQERARRLSELNAQIKGTRKGAAYRPERKALKKQRKDLKREIKSQPDYRDTQRSLYQAGVRQDPSMMNIQRAAPTDPSATLGAIRGMFDAQSGSGPDLAALYRGGGY